MKTNTKRIFGIMVFFTTLYLSGCAIPEATIKENIIIETESVVPAGDTIKAQFKLESSKEITVEVTVSKGDGVKIYLEDKYKYHSRFLSDYELTSYKKKIKLDSGEWNISIINPNSMLSQTVSIKVTEGKIIR